jgi:succinylglutamate desuccinylase
VNAAGRERVIDRLEGDPAGPVLVVVGGVHGNEPAGVDAQRTVFARVRRDQPTLRGSIVGLIGNVRALAARRRYLARDLNRLWTIERVAGARASNADPSSSSPTLDGAELAELAELAAELDQIITTARGPVVALDLHTTSAAGIPFAVVGGSQGHRTFAGNFPMPGIVGLEETLDGVLTRYLSARGCVTMAVEGGQSDSADAATNLEAVITVALAASGVIAADEVTGLAEAKEVLARARGALPQLIEVVSRHEVRPEHGFRMEPGFANIQRTAAGTLLAHDKTGEIRAPFDGLVLLPLYQPQGSDGFFYGREVG